MRIVSVGECMVELSRASEGLWREAFAGDTFNTAWYLRASLPEGQIDYLTCLGRDPVSEDMLRFMQGAGIGTKAITRHPTRVPGLYMINLQNGERSFTYWRERSAARALAADPEHLEASFAEADLIYFSGITLAILTPNRRAVLLEALANAPGLVAFDSNMRPRLWSTQAEMCEWIQRGAAVADIALPSFEEEAQYFDDASTQETARRYHEAGVAEVLVKNGGEAMLALDARGNERELTFGARLQPVDTTGAGDSFNGAYLAARMQGQDVPEAAQAGHRMASRVVMHQGALIPLQQL